MRRRELLQALMIAGATPAFAQGDAPFTAADLDHAKALRERAMRSGLAWELVSSLVREVGPRPAGSAGDKAAMEWALARFQSLGFAAVRAEPVTLTAWQRGPTSVLLLAPEPHPLVATALGNSIGTATSGVEAELAYYADFAALKADGSERARGRIVFIDQKMRRTRDGSGYGEAVMARIAGAVEAARRGAVAVAIRSIGTDQDRIAHTGAMRYDRNVAAIPALAVSVPDADRIAELQAAGRALKMEIRMQAGEKPGLVSHNVIAEVPGSDLKDEVVLIGAHLDTWDISPGAIDDGAGVGITMAAAKVLLDAGVKPRRTVRVVLFANEENGFDGARGYAEKYKDVRHQLVGESDFGADRIWRLRSRVRPDALPAISAMAQVLQSLGVPHEGNEGNPGPDAAMLMRARGWPGIELSQDGTRYFDVHHTVNDTLDRIDPATLPQNVAAWSVVAWLAAQSQLPFGPL
ncbi:MAG: M20/M25/M40 family metallo-hydrolase [Burkholderiales bacterium]|nr:M20/M25/M40 family metallo-hydrolase [Burkholderiales bacterium]